MIMATVVLAWALIGLMLRMVTCGDGLTVLVAVGEGGGAVTVAVAGGEVIVGSNVGVSGVGVSGVAVGEPGTVV
jgi:hypothetical protein